MLIPPQQLDRYFHQKMKTMKHNACQQLEKELQQREIQILEQACKRVKVQHLQIRSQRC